MSKLIGGAAARLRISRAKAERLAAIERQVAEGRLVIRQASAEERERFGIRAPAGERKDGDARA